MVDDGLAARAASCGRRLWLGGSPPLAARAREPEACRPQPTEADGDHEGDAIAPGQVVHDAGVPRRDATADAVAHAEDAVDDAEAPAREQLRGDGGDDGATGAEAEAKEQRVGVERRRVRPYLESEETERAHRRAAVGDGGRRRAP